MLTWIVNEMRFTHMDYNITSDEFCEVFEICQTASRVESFMDNELLILEEKGKQSSGHITNKLPLIVTMYARWRHFQISPLTYERYLSCSFTSVKYAKYISLNVLMAKY